MGRRKKEEEARGGSPEWMATYSDLVTLLVCFFAILFSMSSIDAEKFQAFINSFNDGLSVMYENGSTIGEGNMLGNGINQFPAYEELFYQELNLNLVKERQKEVMEKAKEFEKFLKEADLDKKIALEHTDSYIKLQLIDSKVFFRVGDARLTKSAVDLLDLLNVKLQEYKEYYIKVEGHTDNVPISTEKYPSNWYLSSARAISVAEYLIRTYDFQPELISADGRGEYSPIASNDTYEGRAINRRVEFYIYFNNENTLTAKAKEDQTKNGENKDG